MNLRYNIKFINYKKIFFFLILYILDILFLNYNWMPVFYIFIKYYKKYINLKKKNIYIGIYI